VFSFYGNKIVTSGEGGALTVDDPELEARIRLFRGQGMDPARRYYFPVIGYKLPADQRGVAILCAQLERLGTIVAARQRVSMVIGSAWKAFAIGFQPIALGPGRRRGCSAINRGRTRIRRLA